MERCQTAYNDTIERNGKVSSTNKEANHFYQKVLKRTKRVKSTVTCEVQRIEEVLKGIPIEQQQSLSEAIVQRNPKSNKCKNSRKNKNDDLKKKKVESKLESKVERKVEAAEDEKYSEDESDECSDQFGWSDSDSDNAITIPLGLESNENSINNDGE